MLDIHRCGYEARLQQACVDGAWETTDFCDDGHDDDADLHSDEAANLLSFQCLGAPLNQEDIVRRFPEGADTWIPGGHVSTGFGTFGLNQTFRECTSLTGCAGWQNDPGVVWTLGFRLDADNQLRLIQERADNPVDTTILTHLDGHGIGTATLATSYDLEENERFLYKVTDGCFSISTLVDIVSTGSGWNEGVYGLTSTWDWDLPPRVDRPLAEVVDNEACPAESTDTSSIGATWFGPGQSARNLGYVHWGHRAERWCTDRTGCTPWNPIHDTEQVGLEIRGASLALTIQDDAVLIQEDGTFSTPKYSGWITPDCIRLEEHLDERHTGRAARQEWRSSMVIPR